MRGKEWKGLTEKVDHGHPRAIGALPVDPSVTTHSPGDVLREESNGSPSHWSQAWTSCPTPTSRRVCGDAEYTPAAKVRAADVGSSKLPFEMGSQPGETMGASGRASSSLAALHSLQSPCLV